MIQNGEHENTTGLIEFQSTSNFPRRWLSLATALYYIRPSNTFTPQQHIFLLATTEESLIAISR
jgi:hypothetical protein